MTLELSRPTTWHLDRRIPISIFGILIVQSLMLVIWGAKLDSRVTGLESNALTALAERDVNRITNNQQENRLVRVEANYDNVRETLRDINAKLETLINLRLEQLRLLKTENALPK